MQNDFYPEWSEPISEMFRLAKKQAVKKSLFSYMNIIK